MKLKFRIICWIWPLIINTLGAQARDLILITYHQEATWAWRAARQIEAKTGIPLSLIKVKASGHPCRPHPKTILHLCFNGHGEMKILHQNKAVLQRSFTVFQAATPPRAMPPLRETQDLLRRLRQTAGRPSPEAKYE
jgi:hypothetical protein